MKTEEQEPEVFHENDYYILRDYVARLSKTQRIYDPDALLRCVRKNFTNDQLEDLVWLVGTLARQVTTPKKQPRKERTK
jgi:hypothetical protein